MAYRRLPNTDKARITALIKLSDMVLVDDCVVLLNHKETILDLKEVFGGLIECREIYVSKRVELNKRKRELLIKLKLYVSHFFQVFNFAIDREDIAKECRLLFNLQVNTGVIPLLAKELDIIEWANNIIKGESQRVKKGIESISHPNHKKIKEIKEKTESVRGELEEIEMLFKNNHIEITKQRQKVDAFIKQIWNEIELQFANEPIEIKREQAAEYGVVYIT
tara:strand:+ start:593 stop:1258 length:666 start_codon:yes stop_codon:yes gene_type:complete